MKIILFIATSVFITAGLIMLQLQFMKKYHANAESLIGMLQRLGASSTKK